MLVFDILKNQSEVKIIDQTEWLDENIDLDSLYEVYKQKYEKIKSQLIKEIGQPLKYNHKYITKIKLDLIEYSVFKWQNDYYILGYGQHDRETPVFLCSQKLLS